MQKKIDEMTLNENHDAEFVAKVMNERDRVLAKKEKQLEEARKALERERREQRGHATQECRAGGRAGMQQTLCDWRWLLMGCLSLEAPSSLWTPPLSAHSMPTVYHDGCTWTVWLWLPHDSARNGGTQSWSVAVVVHAWWCWLWRFVAGGPKRRNGS